MTLTSVQIQRVAPWHRRVMAAWGPSWIKLINYTDPADPFPEIRNKVLRIHTDAVDDSFILRGRQGGADYVNQYVLPFAWPWVTAHELTNEGETNDPAKIGLMVEFSLGAMDRADNVPSKPRLVLYNWPEGNPNGQGLGEKVKVQMYAPGLIRATQTGHYFGRHFYWRPGVEGPLGEYHAFGRLKKDIEWLRQAGVNINLLQVLGTEDGIDGGIAPEYPDHAVAQGWQHYVSLQQYGQEIVALERDAARYPWLKGLFLFVSGYEPPWATFDLNEQQCTYIGYTLEGAMTLEQKINQAAHEHVIPWNPATALGKAGIAKGYMVAGDEYVVTDEGCEYVCQSWRDPKEAGYPNIYTSYCLKGDWGNIKWTSTLN